MSDNAKTPENNTGILPPEAEESANFENVNITLAETPAPPLNAAENNSPLGNANTPVPEAVHEENSLVINAETKKPKRQQSAAQLKTITNQAAERQKLKNAGVAKPSVAMVATLTSMSAKGDPNYNSAFANAVSGKPLNQFRTAKKKRKNTVLNTSAATTTAAKTKKSRTKSIFSRNTGTGTQTNGARTSTTRNGNAQTVPRGVGTASQTNMRNKNIVNTSVMNSTVDAVLEMADSIGKQLTEMKRMIKTLKARRGVVRTRKASTASTNSLLGLPPLPPGINTGLSPIPEASQENEFNSGNNSVFYTAH